MSRKLNKDEREEYRMYYYLYDLYLRLAFKNIDRNGSQKKYKQIIVLLLHANNGMDGIKERAYV